MRILVYSTTDFFEKDDIKIEDLIPLFEIIVKDKKVLFKFNNYDFVSFVEKLKDTKFHSNNLNEFVTYYENPREWVNGFADYGANQILTIRKIQD